MSNRERFTFVVVLGFVALVLFTSLSIAKANAHEPYGGCDEMWQAQDSYAAAHCRDRHDYFVWRRMVLGPRKHVQYLAPRIGACEYEDSRNCYWNARTMGNGHGRSFVNLSGRIFFVRGGLPR